MMSCNLDPSFSPDTTQCKLFDSVSSLFHLEIEATRSNSTWNSAASQQWRPMKARVRRKVTQENWTAVVQPSKALDHKMWVVQEKAAFKWTVQMGRIWRSIWYFIDVDSTYNSCIYFRVDTAWHSLGSPLPGSSLRGQVCDGLWPWWLARFRLLFHTKRPVFFESHEGVALPLRIYIIYHVILSLFFLYYYVEIKAWNLLFLVSFSQID